MSIKRVRARRWVLAVRLQGIRPVHEQLVRLTRHLAQTDTEWSTARGLSRACPLQRLVLRCAMPPVVKKSVAKRKQRRCDWARLHRAASRFLTPSQLSLYFRLERLPKVRMFETWTKAAQKDEATFKRVFTDALGFELPDEGVVSGASAGSKAASSEASAAQIRFGLRASLARTHVGSLLSYMQLLDCSPLLHQLPTRATALGLARRPDHIFKLVPPCTLGALHDAIHAPRALLCYMFRAMQKRRAVGRACRRPVTSQED